MTDRTGGGNRGTRHQSVSQDIAAGGVAVEEIVDRVAGIDAHRDAYVLRSISRRRGIAKCAVCELTKKRNIVERMRRYV